MPVVPRVASVWPSEASRTLRSSAAAESGANVASSLAFPRLARVLKPAQFQQVLRRGRRVGRGEWFQLLYAAESVDAGPERQARLGLIVGKRNAPLAVTRNALKRVWREAFRHRRAQLPPGDYVVRLQVRLPELSLTALKARAAVEAARLLEQAAVQQGVQASGRGSSGARSRRKSPSAAADPQPPGDGGAPAGSAAGSDSD